MHSLASILSYSCSIDKQHLAVFRKRPARIVHKLLEPVDRLAEVVHGCDLLLMKPMRKRLLKTIREAGAAGIVRKELTRKSQYLKRLQRDECLEDLIVAGEITVLKTANGSELFKLA